MFRILLVAMVAFYVVVGADRNVHVAENEGEALETDKALTSGLENHGEMTSHIEQELRALRQRVLKQESSLQAAITKQERVNGQQKQEITKLRSRVTSQEKSIKDLERELERQKTTLDYQNVAIRDQVESINHQETAIQSLTASKGKVDAEYKEQLGTQHSEDIKQTVIGAPPSLRYQQTAFGCLTQTLSLSCPDDRLIEVTTGDYGQYSADHPCPEGCCPLHPIEDCTEVVSENRLSDWAAIKLSCDNRTSCSYEYQGSTVDECEEGYIADYLHLFYQCLPDDVTVPVGFTAHAEISRQYNEYDVVIFEDVSSNFGNHYNPATSSFQCPESGAYLFSVSYNSYAGDSMHVDIMKDDTRVAMAWADLVDGKYTHGSAFAIAQCEAGMTVWARSRQAGNMYGNFQRRSQFAGYLLQRT